LTFSCLSFHITFPARIIAMTTDLQSSTPLSRTLRLAALGVASASALWLAGCGSSVKLDEGQSAQVESRDINGSGSSSAMGASSVAPVQATSGDGEAALAGLTRVIYFDFDSFVVREDYRSALEGNARVLAKLPSKRLFVEGHTDERGGREYNLALGQKRAEAVVRSLNLLGVSGEQLEAVSYGEERPAEQGSDESAWEKNRRVELKDR